MAPRNSIYREREEMSAESTTRCGPREWGPYLSKSFMAASRISITGLSISMPPPPPLHHGLPAACRVRAPLELPAELTRLALDCLFRVGALDLVDVPALGEFQSARSGIVRARCTVFPKHQYPFWHTSRCVSEPLQRGRK